VDAGCGANRYTELGKYALSDFYGIMSIFDADAAQYPYRFYRGRKE
jgi:hypothetical protein